jgi:hypothetical protein
MNKIFKVAAKSSNTNSFGLRQHIFVARDGSAFSNCRSYLNELPVGAEVSLPERADGSVELSALKGGELSQAMGPAPKKLVRQLFAA